VPYTAESPLQHYDKASSIPPSENYQLSTLTPNPIPTPNHILTTANTGSNQAVNFTAYTEFKQLLQKWQPQYKDAPIPSYQTTLIGLISGAMGPLSNAPIDTIKTRLQKTPALPGETAMSRIVTIARDMFR
jgi:hypothetical protein